MRRLSLFVRALCAVLLVTLAACGGGGNNSSATGPNKAERASKDCPKVIPFQATFLPKGFTNKLDDGPGGGRSDIKNVVAFHYSGGSGKWIDVFRGGRRNPIGGGVAITVLGRFGRIGHIPGNGIAVKFRLAPQRCASFQLEAFGVSSADTVKVAHGLKPKSG